MKSIIVKKDEESITLVVPSDINAEELLLNLKVIFLWFMGWVHNNSKLRWTDEND